MALTRRGRTVSAIVAGVVVIAAAVLAGRALTGGVITESCTGTANGRQMSVSPDQAGNAATIAEISLRRDLPARAATIGIATAFQESKLTNLDHGDLDSRGLFQQRPSQGWGTAAQVSDPVYATNAFYDVLVKVEGFTNLPVTAAAQQVQRSAFPQAYAAHEADARVLASTLTGYSPAGLTCQLRDAAAGSATARAEAISAELQRSGPKDLTPRVSGGRVDLAFSGRDASRLGWAHAQWAVAKAAAFAVQTVQVSDRIWTRGSDGWQKADSNLGPGHVRITAAG